MCNPARGLRRLSDLAAEEFRASVGETSCRSLLVRVEPLDADNFQWDDSFRLKDNCILRAILINLSRMVSGNYTLFPDGVSAGPALIAKVSS
jgi:hypothetical protein